MAPCDGYACANFHDFRRQRQRDKDSNDTIAKRILRKKIMHIKMTLNWLQHEIRCDVMCVYSWICHRYFLQSQRRDKVKSHSQIRTQQPKTRWISWTSSFLWEHVIGQHNKNTRAWIKWAAKMTCLWYITPEMFASSFNQNKNIAEC